MACVDAADVLVDRKPLGDLRGIERRASIVRIAVAIEIPGRIDERVHGVALAPRVARRTSGHFTFMNDGNVCQRRPALAGDLHIERQHHRQILLRHRHDAALRAMNHRNRRAPVALPRNAPVLDAIRDRGFAEAFSLGAAFIMRRASSLGRPENSPEFSTTPSSVNAALGFSSSSPSTGRITGTNRNPVGLAEFEIALIVRRARP